MLKLVVTLCLAFQLADIALARTHQATASTYELPVDDVPARTPIKRYGATVDDSSSSPQNGPSYFTSNYYDIMFPNRSITDYFIVKKDLPEMTELALCFWIKTGDKKNYPVHGGTIFSYATKEHNNEFVFYDPNNLSLSIGTDTRYPYWKSKISVADSKWHHVCVMWKSQTGQIKLYKDGAKEAETNDIKTGYKIKSGGSLVIGQDQDIVGGGFESDDAYVGELTGINLWNSKLKPSMIPDLSKTCGYGASGNVLTWDDVISGDKYGCAQIKPSTCVNHDKCQSCQ